MRARFTILWFLLGSLLTGCASSAKKAELEEATKGFARALRDGDESILMAYVHPEQRRSFAKNSEPLKDFHFSGVEVQKIFPDEKLTSALVLMSIEYYSRESSALMSSVRQFNWEYDSKVKAWLLKEPTPFGSK